jgi:hypothetical protein
VAGARARVGGDLCAGYERAEGDRLLERRWAEERGDSSEVGTKATPVSWDLSKASACEWERLEGRMA